MTTITTLPLRTPITAGESLDSWIDALARRNDTSPREVLRALGIDHLGQSIRQLVDELDSTQLRRIEAATGLPPHRLDAATGPAVPGIERLSMKSSRFCTRCLAEADGRWQLSWRSSWAMVCGRHRLLLHDTCPEPDCRAAPRVQIVGGATPPPASTCSRPISRSWLRCGVELFTAADLPAPDEVLDAQSWIDQLMAAARAPGPDPAHATLTDLHLVVAWLLRLDPAAAIAAARAINPRRHATPPPPRNGSPPDLDAALTAALLIRARTVLGDDEASAIDELHTLVTKHPNPQRVSPPEFTKRHFVVMPSQFPNRYLRAVDADLPGAVRLRMRTITASAAIPRADGAARIRMLPQLFWPDWAGRLLPVAGGFHTDLFRAALSVLLTVPGDPSQRMDTHAGLLNPRVTAANLSITLQGFDKLPSGSALTDVLVLLCRITEHLDQHGTPIDYQRRREQIPAETLTWDQWRDLACSVGAHPGKHRQGRLRHAQRHLHQLLSGADLADHRHPLAFRTPNDRGTFVEFTTAMAAPLRRALHEHAESILVNLDIDEPLTWSPPTDLADGLALPGIDTGDLDPDKVSRLVVDEHRSSRETAEVLGVHLEHVRIAMERLDQPRRQWAPHAAPAAWLREQHAARLFTREFFDREYIQAGRSLNDIAADTGIGRHIITRFAKQAGISLRRARAPFRIDPVWLREQYCTQLRSTADIAVELGTEQMRVNNALHQHGIPVRPQGVASRTEMIMTFDHLPPNIRAAVEGTLHGWIRLHRFRITMAFPSLGTAAGYLGIKSNSLLHQLRLLERHAGAPLFHRSRRGTAHKPTPHGHALLRELDNEHVQPLMTAALHACNALAMPDAKTLAHAEREAMTPPRNPGLLKPFGDIPVGRLRITRTTLTLLRHLTTTDAEEFYGHGLHQCTSIQHGTLYPLLRSLEQAGWLTSRDEDEADWLAGAPPGCGPGRRRTYYRLTPNGRRAALRELNTPRKRQNSEKPGATNL
ncbi:TniQ family protein [Rhodococcus opacus]|uniref:TniQ family protein n=1 Tax=Rhodococcus opacus TaxID=37919 RepID=UPI0029494883|nr:TniQ family protein [Rhodococcus opacus]MDV6245345.1 TniQ family protein [Rhodococcus opacus]